jgi:hypothetical protein
LTLAFLLSVAPPIWAGRMWASSASLPGPKAGAGDSPPQGTNWSEPGDVLVPGETRGRSVLIWCQRAASNGSLPADCPAVLLSQGATLTEEVAEKVVQILGLRVRCQGRLDVFLDFELPVFPATHGV